MEDEHSNPVIIELQHYVWKAFDMLFALSMCALSLTWRRGGDVPRETFTLNTGATSQIPETWRTVEVLLWESYLRPNNFLLLKLEIFIPKIRDYCS